MTGTSAAIVGASVLLSGSLIAIAVIVRKAVSEAASAARDGAWRGYSMTLGFSVRPPAAKAQKSAEAVPAPALNGDGPAVIIPPRPGYLTRHQAAQRLGVGDMDVRRLVAKGDLVPHPGPAKLVTAESVARLLAAGEQR